MVMKNLRSILEICNSFSNDCVNALVHQFDIFHAANMVRKRAGPIIMYAFLDMIFRTKNRSLREQRINIIRRSFSQNSGPMAVMSLVSLILKLRLTPPDT